MKPDHEPKRADQDTAPAPSTGTAPPAGPRSAPSTDQAVSGFAAPPTITLPKGGGAIRGIGEKFTANPATGTGSFTVPVATSPGRSGFGPQLSLDYDSGHGNGPFGLGWSLQLPAITRRTSLMLPIYRDADESDVFLLSGAEDLVPILDPNNNWIRLVLTDPPFAPGFRVDRYRPRTEGLFARIERWTRIADGQVHWRSITRDNLTTLYGADATSRIADPADPARIFSWLICESFDDRGNAIVYEYKAEDSAGIDPTLSYEGNRTPAERVANRYPKRIRYGNRTPRRPGEDPHARGDWLFEVVFDYGEHDPTTPTPTEAGPWLCRNDPFSQYRPGFEVRTYRLCQRILMFHHFPEPDVGADCLVHSTDLVYASTRGVPDDARRGHPLAAQLAAVTHRGYRRQPGGSYLSRALPAVEFDYSPVQFHDQIADVDPASLANLPAGLATSGARWVDLDGEGIAGVLTEQDGAWSYKANLGGRFAAAELLPTLPSIRALAGGRQQLIDLTGTGTLDVVDYSGSAPGFFERTDDRGWRPFRAFTALSTVSLNDPNLRLLDVTGDGLPDMLLTEADTLTFYPSQGRAGFGPPTRIPVPTDEDRGPRVVFADPDRRVTVAVADMSGDGLADLVRIRNGEVCYWPNLGQGRFGSKITMAGSPRFDRADQFDSRYLYLADVDGSGTTDLIYLDHGGAHIWLNACGNSFTDPVQLTSLPPVDNLTAITVTDLLGTGTACLVWSSPLPGATGRAMRYLDLTGGIKPYLLVGMRNNLGAETHLGYASSTKFYLADQAAGHPWITKLPFPTYVVERVQVDDRVSRNRFVTRYAYHHGHFDPVEREFRGFGMVEQWDSEDIGVLAAADAVTDAVSGVTNRDLAYHVPPVWTKTWFHTGKYGPDRPVSRQMQDEYYREAGLLGGGLTAEQAAAMLLPDTVLPDALLLADGTRRPHDLSPPEAREATRALRGSILRQEVYALDGTDSQNRPYQVSERNYTVELLQPLAADRHAVCFAHPRETVTFGYERALYDVTRPDGVARMADPRVTHQFTLDVDGYGNPLRTASVAYPRRHPDPAADLDPALRDALHTDQARLLATLTRTDYTNAVDDGTAYRTPQPADTRTYELIHVAPARSDPAITNLFGFAELCAQLDTASDGNHDLPYEDVDHTSASTPAPYRRLLDHTRTLYQRNDLTGPLPLGQLETRGLPFRHYILAFTPGLLQQTFQRTRDGVTENLIAGPATVLGRDGGYLDSTQATTQGLFPAGDPAGHWWTPSGRLSYSPNAADTPAQELAYAVAHFFLPCRFTDPFDQTTTISYDPYDLLPTESRDPLDNRTTVGTRNPDGSITTGGHDYRLLQPRLVTDPNGNRAQVAFDALGMVTGTAIMGKAAPAPAEGDSLETFTPDLSPQEITAYLDATDPRPLAITHLGTATTRIIYDLDRVPACAATIARETHLSDLPPGTQTKAQLSFHYSDGFGREVQAKAQAEPGPVPRRDATGAIIIGPDGQPEMGAGATDPRWVGSGWTLYDNKGHPVRKFEPFFSDTSALDADTRIGVSPWLFYDPLGRVVATLHPDHTYEKIVFDPWRQATFDVNDTVLNADGSTDPRNDPDVTAFFARLPVADFSPTWYKKRLALAAGDPDRVAAEQTALHRQTPTTAHHDALGRPFLTIAHNRFLRGGAENEERYPTLVTLDIEGNQRAVRDAVVQNGDGRGRLVMRYDYAVHGARVYRASMEAGQRWTLNDATGKLIRAWDSRGFTRRTTYDEARRPTGLYVTENGTERLAERTVYGESQGPARNHRTRVYQAFDAAGVATNVAYDFKGNVTEIRRDLLPDYRHAVDWRQDPAADDGTYATRTTHDALNRPRLRTTPDASVYRPTFNEAGLLESVEVNLRGAQQGGSPVWTPFVTNVDYDAKGQRARIDYGNGASTTYSYDPETFRLTRMYSTRLSTTDSTASRLFINPAVVQDLRYTYDPTGNITRIDDPALKTVFYDNQQVLPSATYTYDATYRLIEASGREHIGQTTHVPDPPDGNRRDRDFAGLSDFAAHPNDLEAMRNYTERYQYDQVGNMLSVRHVASRGSWTRTYEYAEASLLEATKQSNRLSRTTLGNGAASGETYGYRDAGHIDANGCMTAISSMQLTWDFKDQLHQVDLGGGGTAYYQYDATGQRVRKVIDDQEGVRRSERIYIGEYEIYHSFGTEALARETLRVLHDKQHVAIVETQVRPTADNSLARYQLGNHLGSVAVELDGSAGLITYEEYHPYATSSFQLGRSTAEVSLKRYRYTGKERDEETGFAYHGARYYAPWFARWSSPDPVLSDELNSYAYSRNPVRMVDATGRQPTPPLSSNRNWDDPRNYASYDDFRAAASSPLSDDYLRQRWSEAHPGRASYASDGGSGNISTSAGTESGLAEHPPTTGLRQPAGTSRDSGTVGAPGFGESLIPIWGSGRSSIYHYQRGEWVQGTFFAALAVSDVLLVRSLATSAVKLGIKGLARLAATEGTEAVSGAVTKEAVQVAEGQAARSSETGLVHLTSPESLAKIESTQRLGGRWGIFAIEESQVPSSRLGRLTTTLVPGDLSAEIRITGEAVSAFRRPVPVGPFSLSRYASGIRSTAVGSIDLATGKFLPGEILINDVFRQATGAELRAAAGHQFLLDYGIDSLIYLMEGASIPARTSATHQ